MISINGMNINVVYVTKFLGVHIDSKLNWNEHISVIKTKVAKNVSIMNRVKHCLISSALYSLLAGYPAVLGPLPLYFSIPIRYSFLPSLSRITRLRPEYLQCNNRTG